MIIKIIWAFMWQEQWLTPEIFFNPTVNSIGAALTPDVNEFATRISGIKQTD